MEELPRVHEGGEDEQQLADLAANVERDAGIRQRLIDYGIDAAEQAGTVIDDWVAKHVAQELSDQPDSALDVLARTGEITPSVRAELLRDYEQQPAERRRWIDSLGSYAMNREEAGPVEDWAERTVPPERLVELEKRLRPLPHLGDIPLPPPSRASETGFDWINRLARGWHVEPVWGRDGWDLGAWPYVAVGLFVDTVHDRYAMTTYVEGDVTVQRYGSLGALHVAVNEVAEFHWRLGESRGPDDLPEGKGLLAKHCGPFSQERLTREKAAEESRQARVQRGSDDEQ